MLPASVSHLPSCGLEQITPTHSGITAIPCHQFVLHSLPIQHSTALCAPQPNPINNCPPPPPNPINNCLRKAFFPAYVGDVNIVLGSAHYAGQSLGLFASWGCLLLWGCLLPWVVASREDCTPGILAPCEQVVTGSGKGFTICDWKM